MMEAILHKASTNLNSFGSLYVSLLFRQNQPARKKVPLLRTPAVEHGGVPRMQDQSNCALDSDKSCSYNKQK